MVPLLYTKEVKKIESRYISLFDRTIKKGLTGVPASGIPAKVKVQFRSAGFKLQLDGILNDLVLFASDFTDIELTGKVQDAVRTSAQASFHPLSPGRIGAAHDSLPLTEELIKQSAGLSQEVVASILEVLKDEGIYELHPNELAKRIQDIWGGEKHRAVRFARTFSADVANETALQRYKRNNVRAWRFSALLDEKTTWQCRMLHGTIFYTDSTSAEKYRPPLHFHCRSGMLPVTITEDIDESLVFENRDFKQLIDQGDIDISALTPDLIEKNLTLIDGFKEDYSIDNFILQEDIEKRLFKMKSTVNTSPLKVLKTVKPKAVKPKKLTKEEVRVNTINNELEDIEIKRKELTKEIDRVTEELQAIEYDPKNKELWAKWKAKDQEFGLLDKEWNRLVDYKSDLLLERTNLNKKIEKQLLLKKKKETERLFFERFPASSQPTADEVIKNIPAVQEKVSEKGKRIIEKRVALRDAQYTLKQELNIKYEKYFDDALADIITQEEFERLDEGLNSLRKEISKYEKKIQLLSKAQTENWKKINKEIHKLLYIDDGTATAQFIKMDPAIKGAVLEGTRKAQAEEALNFFNRVMTQELRESIPDIAITELGAGGRAFTREGANMVWVANEDSTSVLIHELGHNFEFNNEFLKYSANKQLTDRTKGEAEVRLLDLFGGNYRLDEVTKKDSFFNAYVGKQYGDKSTEVTSMALQYLYQDPITLYEKDPELFTWIVNAVRGHYK
jgi:SPP1 gp7 family putative phage head morphogenesis protein